MKRTLLFILLLATSAVAQIPDAPSRTLDKKFAAVIIFHNAGTAADILLTHHWEKNCASCYEVNSWLYGTRPNMARMVAINVGLNVGIDLFSYWLKKKYPHSKAWMEIPLMSGGGHAVAAGLNYARY